MHQQPEALRLASMLRACFTDDALVTACAAELRRLHAENQRMASELARPMSSEATLVLHDNTRLRKINKQLLEALENLARLGNGEHYGNSDGNMIARAAIEAAKETQ